MERRDMAEGEKGGREGGGKAIRLLRSLWEAEEETKPSSLLDELAFYDFEKTRDRLEEQGEGRRWTSEEERSKGRARPFGSAEANRFQPSRRAHKDIKLYKGQFSNFGCL